MNLIWKNATNNGCYYSSHRLIPEYELKHPSKKRWEKKGEVRMDRKQKDLEYYFSGNALRLGIVCVFMVYQIFEF